MLTFRQQRFVNEYVTTGNASQSYVAAGYVAKNSNVAAASASALLKNPKVAQAVARGREAVTSAVVERAAARGLVTAEMVMRGLKAEALFKGKNSSHAARVQAWFKLGVLLGLGRQPDPDDFPRVHTIVIGLTHPPAEEKP